MKGWRGEDGEERRRNERGLKKRIEEVGGAIDKVERRKAERMKCAREDEGVGKDEKGRKEEEERKGECEDRALRTREALTLGTV
jgi:hypothetical protein